VRLNGGKENIDEGKETLRAPGFPTMYDRHAEGINGLM
jgi:hypothetical protein